eukprot:7190722-Pyramimonas_sp.AAC.1
MEASVFGVVAAHATLIRLRSRIESRMSGPTRTGLPVDYLPWKGKDGEEDLGAIEEGASESE